MTRILFYNILVGGTHRTEPLLKMIRTGKPDIVGLVEAIDEQVINELAQQLGMQYRVSGRANDEEGWQGAVLSRLPIVGVKIHSNQIITKQPLLEVCIEEPDGQLLTVFVTHLTAQFGKAHKANQARRREVRELLRIMDACRGTKHLLVGDFNSLAPGERLKGSSFLRYVTEPELYYQLKPDVAIQAPNLDFVVPPAFHLINPLLTMVPRSKLLSTLLDGLDAFYAPRGGIDLLQQAGYRDCFRFLHPHEQGFTWPAPLPSGRVDFIFASPELATELISADVLMQGEDVSASQASDHIPVIAAFGNAFTTQEEPEEKEATETHSELLSLRD